MNPLNYHNVPLDALPALNAQEDVNMENLQDLADETPWLMFQSRRGEKAQVMLNFAKWLLTSGVESNLQDMETSRDTFRSFVRQMEKLYRELPKLRHDVLRHHTFMHLNPPVDPWQQFPPQLRRHPQSPNPPSSPPLPATQADDSSVPPPTPGLTPPPAYLNDRLPTIEIHLSSPTDSRSPTMMPDEDIPYQPDVQTPPEWDADDTDSDMDQPTTQNPQEDETMTDVDQEPQMNQAAQLGQQPPVDNRPPTPLPPRRLPVDSSTTHHVPPVIVNPSQEVIEVLDGSPPPEEAIVSTPALGTRSRQRQALHLNQRPMAQH